MSDSACQSVVPPRLDFDAESRRLSLSGSWTVLCLDEDTLRELPQDCMATSRVVIDGYSLSALDSAGARAVLDLESRLREAGVGEIELARFSEAQQHLLALVGKAPRVPPPSPPSPVLLENLGRATFAALAEMLTFLAFIGALTFQTLRWLLDPRRIRGRAVLAEMQIAGVNALFIVGLLSFLMGIVIAYQGGGPLDKYGANIFIVDLVGLTMLREIAPLVTAIIMAGRTGSAYTAEIGAMRITEEVEALRSLAIHPLEILVLPKLVAMMVVMPLLFVFADFAGLGGGIVVSDLMFGVNLTNYLERLPQTFLMPSSFWVGLIKAPVFALIITSIGCHQGFQVRGGATSVGYATTRSVVESIFLVIVVDAVFSIVFNKLDL